MALAPAGDREDVVADIQDQIQALGLNLPDPSLESKGDEGATALSDHSSSPMNPEHVKLVKWRMAELTLPAPGATAWDGELQTPRRRHGTEDPPSPAASPSWK